MLQRVASERLQNLTLMFMSFHNIRHSSPFCLHADTAYVRIFITDVNDNAPAFAQPVYEVSVEEDKEVGFVLITVTANDEDEGQSESHSLLLLVGERSQ